MPTAPERGARPRPQNSTCFAGSCLPRERRDQIGTADALRAIGHAPFTWAREQRLITGARGSTLVPGKGGGRGPASGGPRRTLDRKTWGIPRAEIRGSAARLGFFYFCMKAVDGRSWGDGHRARPPECRADPEVGRKPLTFFMAQKGAQIAVHAGAETGSSPLSSPGSPLTPPSPGRRGQGHLPLIGAQKIVPEMQPGSRSAPTRAIQYPARGRHACRRQPMGRWAQPRSKPTIW